MGKQEIKAVIVNPEALEAASIRLTNLLFDLWWKENMDGGSKNNMGENSKTS